MNNTIILFDLFDTILDNACIDFRPGLKTVWLNREKFPNTDHLPVEIIENFDELLNII